MEEREHKHKIRYIEHPSDVGFEVYGTTLEELFANAAIACYGFMTDIEEIDETEERAESGILELAKSKKVVLLSSGDPMIATTHVELRLRAIDRGIETRIVHAASIASAAAGLSGLQSYKFGKSATVSPPYKGVISRVPYETVRDNKERGLHTLLYLDIGMSIADALELLDSVEREMGGDCWSVL